jgi:hypothetical protein
MKLIKGKMEEEVRRRMKRIRKPTTTVLRVVVLLVKATRFLL